MGLFKKSTRELEAELIKAKKQKVLLDKKAQAKDIEINKRIAEKEKRDQLKFEIERLKRPPRSQAELLIKKQRLAKAKKLVGSLGSAVGRGVIDFLQKVDKAYPQQPIRKITKKKKISTKKKVVKKKKRKR